MEHCVHKRLSATDTQKLPYAEPVHTRDCPFCSCLDCWCHTTVSYHDAVMHPIYSEKEFAQAYTFYMLPCFTESIAVTMWLLAD